MNILLAADPILPVPPTGYGGIERIVDGLVRAYQKRGHQVGLIAKRGSTCTADHVFHWPGERVSSLPDTVRNAFALRGAAHVFAADVIHSFARLAYLTAVMPRRVRKIMSYQRHVGARQIRIAGRLSGRSLRFTGCSDFICRQGRTGGGAWRAIPNFVDLDRYTFVPKVATDAPLVFLSRLESIKGPDLAISIAKRAGRRLILAGNRPSSGAEVKYFEAQIAPSLGRDGIEWIGEVNDTQKNELLGKAAALLVPIQWDEPFGIVFVEAMATGTPVITCARGATPEIIEPNRTGYFIDGAADGAMAVQRLDLLDRAACRNVVETQFSADVCADQYLALYAEMTAPRSD